MGASTDNTAGAIFFYDSATERLYTKPGEIMDGRLILLKHVLDGLGIPAKFWESEEAKRTIQRGIYLAQETGLRMGYRFAWYAPGPISTQLLNTLHELAICLDDEGNTDDHRTISDIAAKKVRIAKEILEVPDGLSLEPREWGTVVVCTHYLMKIMGQEDLDVARAKLREVKPTLSDYIPAAEAALLDAGYALGRARR